MRGLILILSFAVILLTTPAWPGPNGRFSAPTFESFKRLSEDQRAEYEKQLPRLHDPLFVNLPHYKTPSFYTTPQGKAELDRITAELIKLAPSHGRFVFIGRSGSGIMAYLSGVLSRMPGASELTIGDFPFSCAEPKRLTSERKKVLRSYLEENGLSPRAIAAAAKPVLFFDFVYTGTGSMALLEAIHYWAAEEGIADAVKAKMSFYGAYPPRLIVEAYLMRLRHDLIRDGGFKEFTKEYIENEVAWREMPAKWTAERICAHVHSFRLSDEMYIYAGTHVANAQSSFTPDKWETPGNQAQVLEFQQHAGEAPFLELYYLMETGARETGNFQTFLGCESPLRVK
jgi:hypothetical protein